MKIVEFRLFRQADKHRILLQRLVVGLVHKGEMALTSAILLPAPRPKFRAIKIRRHPRGVAYALIVSLDHYVREVLGPDEERCQITQRFSEQTFEFFWFRAHREKPIEQFHFVCFWLIKSHARVSLVPVIQTARILE